jgi:hypothetical protein
MLLDWWGKRKPLGGATERQVLHSFFSGRLRFATTQNKSFFSFTVVSWQSMVLLQPMYSFKSNLAILFAPTLPRMRDEQADDKTCRCGVERTPLHQTRLGNGFNLP